jgi:serine protease Do
VNREEAPATADLLGLTISGMTDELRDQLGLAKDAEGLVVTSVAEDSEAFEKGLRVGDIITEAAQESVASIADLNGRVEAAREAGRKSLVLLVRRDGDPRFVALTLDDG